MTPNKERPRLSVKVYGMDLEGRPFFETVRILNPTLTTAVLEGTKRKLRTGEVLGVQYENRKARVVVVWISEVEQSNRIQVRLLTSQQCPWAEYVAHSLECSSGVGRERRSHPRYRIKVALDLYEHESSVKLQTQSTDISLSGCYVETMTPFPVDTPLRARLWLDSECIDFTALVRTCDGNVGMGIEFVNLSADQKTFLNRFLTKFQAHSLSTS